MNTRKYALALTIALSIAGHAVSAEQNTDGLALQSQSQIENEIKAFVYDWYGRFDREVSVKELAKNLPENEIQFVYPQATVTRTDDFLKQVKASRQTVEYSAHNVGDIFLYPTDDENVYTVLTPHTYYTARKDGTYAEIDIASRMSIELNKANSKDKKGLEPKIASYAVTFQKYATQDISEQAAELKFGKFSHADVKSFVHTWFAAADEKDATTLKNMTSKGNLNINLLGQEIKNRSELYNYMSANSAAQKWASHSPLNIQVTNTNDGVKVDFLIHFEGEIEGLGELTLNNATSWVLIEENGKLRLRDYTLNML